MKTIFVLATLCLLASCTTTVRRLTLKGYELGDGRHSAYYDLVEEVVPSYKGRDYAVQVPSTAFIGDALQLFPSLAIKRATAPGTSRLTVRYDMLKPVGQVLVIDGSTPLLSSPVFQISSASISSDGKTVAFSCRERPNSPWTVWLVGADGREPRMLCKGRDPDWLPTGKLVFSTQREGKHAIVSCAVDGGGESIVLTDDHPLSQIAVNPANGSIAYVKTRTEETGADGDVWLYDRAKEASVQITAHPARDDAPVWSADGKTLFFRSTRSGSWGIWFNERLDGRKR